MPRQQTLRATMDWSFDLLSEPERAVLLRLAVFAGSLSLEAAELVCASDPVVSADVLDLLSRLVEKSLVVAEPSGDGRYRLLETIRLYARDRLIASGEAEAVRRRHRNLYLALVERAAPEFFHGAESGTWLDRLDLEHDNLLAALQWSIDEPTERGAALRMATGMWRFWEIRGHPYEGRGWLERTLAGADEREPPLLVADALTGAAVLSSMQGDDAAAVGFHERSLAVQRRLGNLDGVAYALNNLAGAAVRQGDLIRARTLYEECVAITRQTGDERARAFALINLAGVVADLGDVAAARAGFDDSLAIFDRFGDRWGAAFARDEFAVVLARQGDGVAARSLLDEALATWRELGDQRGVARVLAHLADVASLEGDQLGGPHGDPPEPGDPPVARRHAGDRGRDGEAGLDPGGRSARIGSQVDRLGGGPARGDPGTDPGRDPAGARPAAGRARRPSWARRPAPSASVRAGRWPRSRSSRRFRSDGSAGA